MVGLERSEFKPMDYQGTKAAVAIASRFATTPSFILGDEPTGALDTKTSVQIMELFLQFNVLKTIAIITYEPEVASNVQENSCLRDEILNTKR